jgi:3-oxoacid CoA-transferase B subunit
MAARAAQELQDGFYVNLGIGIPTLVANFVPADKEVWLQSENGMLGIGQFPTEDEVDADLINAGKQTITELPTTSYFSSSDSFAMIRGGHIDVTILGAFEVASNGDLANWDNRIPDKGPLVGGAMDLAASARAVWVMMEHNTRKGGPRLLAACTLPLTAVRCVKRVYTDIAVLSVTPQGFLVHEILPGISRDELQRRTGAPLAFAPDCKDLVTPDIALPEA